MQRQVASSKKPQIPSMFLWLRVVWILISRAICQIIICDFIMLFGIFFKAKMELVFLCCTIITVPNLPSPSVFSMEKSSREILWAFFLASGMSINLFGGDLESELLVLVGEATCLNLSSQLCLGIVGVKHSIGSDCFLLFFLNLISYPTSSFYELELRLYEFFLDIKLLCFSSSSLFEAIFFNSFNCSIILSFFAFNLSLSKSFFFIQGLSFLLVAQFLYFSRKLSYCSFGLYR